jgi:cytochrome P450
MQSLEQFSMTDADTARCPFSYYAAMRREQPVHRDPGTGIWWVTRHEDVLKAALDTKGLSSQSELITRNTFKPKAQAIWDASGVRALKTLVTADPPEHDEYRNVGLQLFPQKTVEELTPKIHALVDELVDSLKGKQDVEFISDFAARLPGTVVCDEFGLPRKDQPRFKAWTDAIIGLLDPSATEEREVELIKLVIEMFRYLEQHLQRAALEPPGRVIHTLATMSKRDGTPFTALERSWLLMTTFVGGNETTMNMLAMGMRKLATDPALQSELRAHPEKVGAFVEEMLRLEGSVQALLRVATRDIDIGGTVIPKGANVALCSGSANRDEKQWPDADAFRLDRKNGNRHVTFGYGRHSCIGMHLARRELVIAFTSLLAAFSDIRLSVPEETIEQVPLPFHRAIARLPIKLTQAA